MVEIASRSGCGMWKTRSGGLEHAPHSTPEIGSPSFVSDHGLAGLLYVRSPRQFQLKIPSRACTEAGGAPGARAVVDKGRWGRSVFGYKPAICGVGSKPTVAKTGKAAGKMQASSYDWRGGPDLDAFGCSELNGDSARLQKPLRAGRKRIGTEGQSTDVRGGKRR